MGKFVQEIFIFLVIVVFLGFLLILASSSKNTDKCEEFCAERDSKPRLNAEGVCVCQK
jgi:large-conductance mechanosensitive channel